MTTKYTKVKTPDEAVSAIVSGAVELRIPKNVRTLSFIAQTRAKLHKRGLVVGLHDAQRNYWKGIVVTK